MYVSSPGLVCPVGLDAESACAALRAGIAQFEELPYRDNSGEPVIGATVPGMAPDLPRSHRLLELLAPALQETIGKVPSLPWQSIPLIVCLAEPGRPGGCGHLARDFVGAIERKIGVSFHPDCSGVIVKGHTGGFRALRVARRLFQEGDILACLICGVDSYINATSLNWLDAHWRLKTEENSDGVVPGECAAAMLVTPTATEQAVKVRGLGFAQEKAVVLNEEPLLGLGMTEAVRIALTEAALTIHDFDFRVSDVTGESYGFRELSLALARFEREYREEFPIWHAAEAIGDTGAAAGLFQIAMAHGGTVGGYAPGDRALCHSAAIGGDRAVAALQRAPVARQVAAGSVG